MDSQFIVPVALFVGFVIGSAAKDHTEKDSRVEGKNRNNEGGTREGKNRNNNEGEIREGRIVPSQMMKCKPTTRMCFYCSQEGRELPIELFTRNPCCGHFLCIYCREKHRDWCGECMTQYPKGGEPALLWIMKLLRDEKTHCDRKHLTYLEGRLHVMGQHSYVDEIDCLPLYEPLRPVEFLTQALNPGNAGLGRSYLRHAATLEYVPAMLALADVHSMHLQDMAQAEVWYQRALGKGATMSAVAFTRYGEFLASQGRTQEAAEHFRFAAEQGHVLAQYAYAEYLLEGETSDGEISDTEASDKQAKLVQAVKWLCKAAETGFHVSSSVLLAKTLIDTSERNTLEGRADIVGQSPLPRAYQILNLAKASDEESETKRIKLSRKEEDDNKNEIQRLFDSYDATFTLCNNCGEPGTDANPLFKCERCKIVCYCSKLCRKQHFRDGHKLDCCSPQQVFRHDLFERTLMPPRSATSTTTALLPPYNAIGNSVVVADNNNNTKKKSLSRMVEDFTDEVNDGEDEDYNAEHLVRLMSKMRKNLEIYLKQKMEVEAPSETNRETEKKKKKKNLAQLIEAFSAKNDDDDSQDFASAMHSIRLLGNSAVHGSQEASAAALQLDQIECIEAVRRFMDCKHTYESQCNLSSKKQTRNISHPSDHAGTHVELRDGSESSKSNTNDGTKN